MSWCKKTCNKLDEYLIPHYWGSLSKFKKKTGCYDMTNYYFIRDCQRKLIWRKKFYPNYKSNRKSTNEIIGKNIKCLNEQCIK